MLSWSFVGFVQYYAIDVFCAFCIQGRENMTTVVVDCNQQRVFADTLSTVTYSERKTRVWSMLMGGSTNTGRSHWVVSSKIYFTDCGQLLVGTGDRASVQQFRHYARRGLPAPTENTRAFVMFAKDGCVQITEYSCGKKQFGSRLKWQQETTVCDSGWIVAGSGCKYALGALHAGCSPEVAIQAAAKIDPCTGSGVESADIPRLEK